MLLDSSQVKDKIEFYSKHDTRAWFYSAFATRPALEWIERLRSNKARLLIRGRVDDFLSGASDIGAVKYALELGWEVRFSSVIHFKVYFFDKILIVGSSNFTAKGLALVPNHNLEFNAEEPITPDSIVLAEKLWGQGQEINIETIGRMYDYLSMLDTNDGHSIPNDWPEEVLPVVERDMYCSDFPQSIYGEGNCPLNIKSFEDLNASIAYQWIIQVVKENNMTWHLSIT